MDARTEDNGPTLEELHSLPWTRELVPDEGGFFARIQELDGCISEGETAAEALENLDDALFVWLEVAVEHGSPIPPPRSELDEYSGRFSVRVPKTLHRALTNRAEREGVSLNQLVTVLLSAVTNVPTGMRPIDGIGPTVEAPPATDAHDDIAADAVRTDSQGVGALKGIATWLRNRGDINLAVVLYALAAERSLAIFDDRSAAGSDFGMAGALAGRHRHNRLAERLWRESIRYDPTNIRSRSSLGQLLQRQGRFAEAIDCLEPVAEIDNYAQMSLGWSLLYQGIANGADDLASKGLANLTTAMRRWCVYANRSQFGPWLRHLIKLDALGSRYSTEVDHLLDFANSNANWGRVDRNSLGAQLPIDEAAEEADERAALDAASPDY